MTNGIANTKVLPDPVNETTFASHSPTTSGLSAYRCTGSGLAYPNRSKFLNKILNAYVLFYDIDSEVRLLDSHLVRNRDVEVQRRRPSGDVQHFWKFLKKQF